MAYLSPGDPVYLVTLNSAEKGVGVLGVYTDADLAKKAVGEWALKGDLTTAWTPKLDVVKLDETLAPLAGKTA